MKLLDIILIVLLLFGAFRGYQKGLLLELINFISFFLALILAFNFKDWGAGILQRFLDQPEGLLNIVAFVAIFIIVIFGLDLLGKAVKSLLDLTLLGSLDDLAGGLVGALKWALMISIFLWIFELFDIGISPSYSEGTIVFPYVYSIAPFLLDMLAVVFPFIHDMLDNGKQLLKDQEQMAYAFVQTKI
ncbi:MAG: CvpA family protein [Cyclobacteriaceae bacterium]